MYFSALHVWVYLKEGVAVNAPLSQLANYLAISSSIVLWYSGFIMK